MDQLTNNDLQQLDTTDLMARAEAIRDAITAKSVSASQVGQLFCDLIGACGDINSALRLFLTVNVPEIQADIDNRLSGVDEAAANAAAETQQCQQTRAQVASLVSQLTSQNLSAPKRVDVDSAPTVITLTNETPQKIKARLFPSFGLGSVLFISDNKAVEVTPDGYVRPLAPGTSKVNALATTDTSIYKPLCIEVVPPRLRLAGVGALRLDGKGNIRLT
ncbi:MAG: hypothetical protein HUK14_04860 [Muribaculaceae bacterium]|nr:hypothetical protein [Muribaculaceae bacterium]